MQSYIINKAFLHNFSFILMKNMMLINNFFGFWIMIIFMKLIQEAINLTLFSMIFMET